MSSVIRLLDNRLQGSAGSMPPDTDRILRLPELVRRSGLSRATLYRRMACGDFPALQSLGGQSRGLRESIFLSWMAGAGKGGAE
jgi:prophage regulatory protein